ncbi:MAG: hypothetical protein J6Q99_01535 [Oscillospiraceae bacterium]|nr:hypothetical protein [Oscillospiraceae bacterium]
MNELNTQTPEMTALMEKLEQSAQVQQKCARRQSLMMTVSALACVGILVLAGLLFFRLQPVMHNLEAASQTLGSLADQLSTVDLGSAADSLTQAAAKLELLDIDTLNTAIGDLAEVISPLARLFGRAG